MMTELALEKMRSAVNKYREESGISIKTLAFSLEGFSEQQLRNVLNKTDGGPKAVEMLAKLIEIYPIKINQKGVVELRNKKALMGQGGGEL